MNHRPILEMYVTRGCSSCRRAERAIRDCEQIRQLVDVAMVELGSPGVLAPPSVVAGPTLVFRGVVVALGTPDCGELAERLCSLLAQGAVD